MAMRQPAQRPSPRSERRFYATSKAFGRFGMRAFSPQLMQAAHVHGHIEFNWLTAGEMDYRFDGHPVTIGANCLVAFWAGIPHQTTELRDAEKARQLNLYLPMDAFLEMPQLGRLTETLMGGGVIALTPDSASLSNIERWYADYRSGNAQRSDLVRAEIALLFRRAALVGWTELLPPWIEKAEYRERRASPTRYVVQMVRHIVENITSPLLTEDVAAVAGLHPNYATNLFTGVMHIPMQKFITRLRLIRARSLLFDTNLSVANIAIEAGFSSQSQFYEHFRNAYGTTPSQMRKG
jgi:AraC-like DNA-binding protein